MAQYGERKARMELRRIDAAVRRCADGSYGVCLGCDEPIDERRLDVDPAAELCIECAEAQHQ